MHLEEGADVLGPMCPLTMLLVAPVAATLASAIIAFAAKSAGAALSVAAAARPDKWIVIGPGGGGAQFDPAVSPHDPKVVFLHCDMMGSYVSRDGGRSWRVFNLRTNATFFVFDPSDPNVAYAYADGLWKTRDLGDTWELVYPNPDRVNGIIVNGDHAEWTWDTSPPTGRIIALAIDPSDSNLLYAAIEKGSKASLHRSMDAGRTWMGFMEGYPVRTIASPLDHNTGAAVHGKMDLYIDPHSPARDRTIYFVENNRVAVRKHGIWTRFAPALRARRFLGVSLGWRGKAAPPVIYAVVPADWKGDELSGGILVSEDGGRTWECHNDDFSKCMMRSAAAPLFQAIATCINDPSTAYVSYRFLRFGAAKWDYHFGVAKSRDSGRNWDLVIKDSYYKACPAEKDAWLNEYYHPEWGDAPFCLEVAPTDPNICYGTDFGRTMRTTDGLKTWVGVYSRKIGAGWATTGLDVTTSYGVHRDPHEPGRIVVSYTDMGSFRSEDGGVTWVHAVTGVPSEWHNTMYWCLFDPEVKGQAWAAMSPNHDLPRPKMWRGRQDVSHLAGGIVISHDGGATWTKSVVGMDNTATTHVIMDPSSPLDARVLYAAGFGTGVWKSIDSARSWSLKREGLKGKEPFAWRLALSKTGILYLVVARRSEDGSFGNDLDGALYRSSNGADSWQEIPLPRGVNGPNGILIDPQDDKRLYLACWGRNHDGGAVDGGIFMSQDAGASWTNVFDANQYVYDVTADVRDPNVLYACGFESSAWRSDDRGLTWNRIKGFNFKWGHRVMSDPLNPDMIFITTFGSSVWYGPAKGDPDAVEDITTPSVSYERLKR